MALSNTECKRQDTLTKLRKLSGCPFPIGYAKFADERVHYGDPSWTSCIDMYFSEEERNNNPDIAHHFFLGGNLSEPDFIRFQQSDNRDTLYPHAEYLIHFQDAQRRQQTDPTFDAVAEQSELDALRDELGIETLFRLIPDAPADTATEPDPA